MEFAKSEGEQTVTFDITPDTGSLYLAALQTKGNSSMSYSTYYKKFTDSNYDFIRTFRFDSNNVLSKEYSAGKVKKGKKYNCKVTRTKADKKSAVDVHWLLK